MKTISLLRRLVCAALLFMLSAPFAAHAQSNGYVIGPQIGAAYLYSPRGLAVDNHGNVYVVDVPPSSYSRIVEFSNSGTFINQFGDPSGNGQIYTPNSVAVDANGNVLVADTYRNRIAKFSSTGVYTSQFATSAFVAGSYQSVYPDGIALDAQGNIFISFGVFVVANTSIVKFSNNGTYITQFGSNYYSIASDTGGNIFAEPTNGNDIDEFTNSGSLVTQFSALGYTAGIAVDTKGDLFYGYEGRGGFVELSNNGAVITEITDDSHPNVAGIAVDTNGKIFISHYYDSAYIAVYAPAPSIASITTNATNPVISSDSFQATVTLDKPAPVDLDVQITAKNLIYYVPALIPPTTVHFTAGQTMATFTVNTNFITRSETDTLTATLNSSSQSVNVTVSPISVASITFPASAAADTVVPGTVKLNHAVPPGQSLTLSLTSSNVSVAQFTVIGGHSATIYSPNDTASVAVLTQDVPTKASVTLTAKASAEDAGKTATMTVTPFEPILYYSIAPTRDKTTGDTVLTIQITDFGPAPTTNYTVTSATLNNIATTTTLPTAPVTFASKGSNTVVLHFPGSVGAEGQSVPFVMKATYGNSTAYVTNTNTLNANVTLPATQLAGTITFDGLVAYAPAQNVTFTFRPNDNSGNITKTLAIPPSGAYTLGGLPNKAGVLHIKPAMFLAVNLPINLTGGNVAGANATVEPADGNNDNSVDSDDFGLLIGAFNTDITVPGSGYDPTADFNGDGSVDSSDFALLIGNFNNVGAP